MWVMCGMVKMSEERVRAGYGLRIRDQFESQHCNIVLWIWRWLSFFHSRPSWARRESWRRGTEWFLASDSCVSCTHIMKMDTSFFFLGMKHIHPFHKSPGGCHFFANISSITNSSHSQASLRSVIILQTDYKSFAGVSTTQCVEVQWSLWLFLQNPCWNHNVDRSQS